MKYTSLPLALFAVACLPTLGMAVGLTGYYKLDDGSLSTASATVGADATYSAGFDVGDLGQPGSPGDPTGSSVSFPTSGEQLIAVPSAGGITDGNQFSITMWVQFANETQDHTLATNGTFSGTTNLLWWRDDGGGATDTLAGMVDGDPRANGTNNILEDSDWHLVALTYDNTGSNEQLYLDGVNITANTPGADGALNGDTINLGNVAALTASKQFEGLMDEVGFWDRALTAPEMDALFFLSEGEGEFVADAQGAADIFDFFENGAVGDQAVFNGIGFEIVDDVVALGGIAGQSTEVDGQLLLGLNGTTGGLASFAVPEPTSIAVWSLAGLIALGLGRRSWNRRRDIQFN